MSDIPNTWLWVASIYVLWPTNFALSACFTILNTAFVQRRLRGLWAGNNCYSFGYERSDLV